jgi:hypothetical protein
MLVGGLRTQQREEIRTLLILHLPQPFLLFVFLTLRSLAVSLAWACANGGMSVEEQSGEGCSGRSEEDESGLR